ncbi:MAG: UvrD-helicase domain-containing protein [Chloroflexi bacterium]|nr:UvrD-helicase domain-containing protein [Chloroflexota bacterium]
MVVRALKGLNPAQQEAVSTVNGPLLILAGPGSGKTRVIVHRVAYLLESAAAAPEEVLAVTFTNKAAREMRERLEALVGRAAYGLTVGTFHATCARWLRRDGVQIGIDPSFAIYDDRDQMDLMKEILRELSIDEKRWTPRTVLHEISSAKSEHVGPLEYSERATGRFQDIVARCYHRYQAMLRENHAVDFDDLLGLVVRLFTEQPRTLARYQDRYRYILVDEFQDTNVVQYQLVKLLASRWRNICVVGDPDQSIYGWRKADLRNILNFEHDYPELKVVRLEQNYRSTQRILDVAQSVIRANTLRKEKDLWTENVEGTPATLYGAYDERDEALYIVREVERGLSRGGRLSDYAVMYRTNAQSRALEESMVRAGVPYRLVGGTRFYERKEIKDLIAYLRLVQNPYDGVSLQRVINTPPRGIGVKTVSELFRWAKSLRVSAYEALLMLSGRASGSPEVEEAASDTRLAPIGLNSRARQALADFTGRLEALRLPERGETLELRFDRLLFAIGYERYLRDGTEEGEERWQNVLELRVKSRDYDDLEPEVALQRFLEEVALVQDVDSMDTRSEAVTLITLHAAKGLEFPCVFLTGLEEGLCPHIRAFDDPAQLEEERRLFYVGVTRAMRQLYLIFSLHRTQFGTGGGRDPSRFLRDIPAELVELANDVRRRSEPRPPPRDEWSQEPVIRRAPSAVAGDWGQIQPAVARSREPGPPDDFSQVRRHERTLEFGKGDAVRHPRYGDGIVVESRLVGDDEQVTVLFKSEQAPKKFSMSFAPLRRV